MADPAGPDRGAALAAALANDKSNHHRHSSREHASGPSDETMTSMPRVGF